MVRASGITKFDCNDTKVPRCIVSILKKLKSELLLVEDVESVVLFGSYSKGTYTPTSDIDLAVFVRDGVERSFVDIFRELQRCAANYMLDIQILLFASSLLECPMGIVEEVIAYGRDITLL